MGAMLVSVRRRGKALRQPPVKDGGLSVGAEQDIGGFQIPMNQSEVVSERNGLTHPEETSEQFPELSRPLVSILCRAILLVQLNGGLVQCHALNEAHGEKQPSLSVSAHSMNGWHARML
jgi:hypothetical protein